MNGAWQENSVAKFGAVHKKLKEEGKDETTRGESLRELQRFFKEHDKDEGYAGLRRIADEDGTAVWTILKETEVAKKLEERRRSGAATIASSKRAVRTGSCAFGNDGRDLEAG